MAVDIRYQQDVFKGDQRLVAYLRNVPAAIPAGQVLVHNFVRPTRRLGSRGFRAWLADPDLARFRPCRCGWAHKLGQHFTMRAYAPARTEGG